MRIAFIVNNFLPKMGGMESHIAALARQLADRGHDVFVVNLGAEQGSRKLDGFEVRTLRETHQVGGVLGFPLPGTRRSITRLLRDLEIDIVSTHTRFFPMSFVGLRAARKLGIPVIHTEHGSDYVASSSKVIAAASRLVDRTFGKAVLRGAARVLGVSEDVCAFVRRLAGVNAQLFYNAISLTEGPDTSGPDRPEHLVFVGRIVSGKGWDTYLDLVSRLQRRGNQVSGEVLGDGAEMPMLLSRIKQLGLESIVKVRGRTAPEEVRRVLRGSTLVNPTILSEGFQTTLLEAIAERGRVLTYPVPGATVLRDSGAPVCIATTRSPEALEKVAIAMFETLPEPAAPGFIDEWTWPARAAEYLEVCSEILGDSAKRKLAGQ